MTCEVCYRRNRSGARFCDNCGRPLPESFPPGSGRLASPTSGRHFPGARRSAPEQHKRFPVPVPITSDIDRVAAAVERKSTYSYARAGHDAVTILFTDIQDSTALNERLGDRKWMEVLHRHNAIVREQVSTNGGIEVKAMGDGFMLTFPSAEQGADCAIAVQRALAADNPLPSGPLSVRIGLHTGPVVHDGADVFGHHVNLSARIAAAARGRQITISDATRRLVAGARFKCLDRGEAFLRGFAEPVRIHELLWE